MIERGFHSEAIKKCETLEGMDSRYEHAGMTFICFGGVRQVAERLFSLIYK